MNNCFNLQAKTLLDDATESFHVAVERNDPAGIDSLLRRREVTFDQVLKVYYNIWWLQCKK